MSAELLSIIIWVFEFCVWFGATLAVRRKILPQVLGVDKQTKEAGPQLTALVVGLLIALTWPVLLIGRVTYLLTWKENA